MRKHLCSLIVGSLCILSGYAQNINVHVKSQEEYLPFSYVLINGKYPTAADSTGMATIPKGLLKIGDTLSARYVGAREASEIFDGQDELVLNLPGLEIGSIIILSKTDRKNLWRNINRHKIRKAYQKITCRFEVYKNADTAHVSSGHAKYWFHPSSGYEIRGGISRLQNDANLTQPILNITKHIINDAFTNVVFKTWVTTNKDIQILKENSAAQGMDVYTILRPAVIGEDLMNESSKIFVDPATKNIVKSVALSEFRTFTMLYAADYRVETDYYIPHHIECTITFRAGDPRSLHYSIFDLQLDMKRDKDASD